MMRRMAMVRKLGTMRSFELSYEIPPRYFFVTMHMKLLNQDEASDMMKLSAYDDHRANIKSLIQSQRVILNGETLDLHGDGA